MKIKNNTLDSGVWNGQEIAAGALYELQQTEIYSWANNQTVLSDLLSGSLKLENGSLIDDGVLAVNILIGKIPLEVVTSFEKNDKRLKCACAKGEYDVNGDCIITVRVPDGGRWIAGGSAFTDVFHAGDIVTAVQLTDEDNLLTYGAGTVLASYEDAEADAGQIGWFFEPDANNTGFIEIEPIGGYALLPEGFYLKIVAKKEAASTATKVFVNVWWGKEE